eukprot:COSAG02_NODE_1865_length_10601_cov_116.823748_9_plen_120_part_00
MKSISQNSMICCQSTDASAIREFSFQSRGKTCLFTPCHDLRFRHCRHRRSLVAGQIDIVLSECKKKWGANLRKLTVIRMVSLRAAFLSLGTARCYMLLELVLDGARSGPFICRYGSFLI